MGQVSGLRPATGEDRLDRGSRAHRHQLGDHHRQRGRGRAVLVPVRRRVDPGETVASPPPGRRLGCPRPDRHQHHGVVIAAVGTNGAFSPSSRAYGTPFLGIRRHAGRQRRAVLGAPDLTWNRIDVTAVARAFTDGTGITLRFMWKANSAQFWSQQTLPGVTDTQFLGLRPRDHLDRRQPARRRRPATDRRQAATGLLVAGHHLHHLHPRKPRRRELPRRVRPSRPHLRSRLPRRSRDHRPVHHQRLYNHRPGRLDRAHRRHHLDQAPSQRPLNEPRPERGAGHPARAALCFVRHIPSADRYRRKADGGLPARGVLSARRQPAALPTPP